MADFRSIKCAMWREDDWFLDLPIDARLFWIYLFSNPSASVAGIYRLSLRTMANECGLSTNRIAELLDAFAKDRKAFFADGVIWVVKMREHQGSDSPLVQKRIAKDIAMIPPDNPVYRMYATQYHIDTISIPDRTDTDTDTVTDTIQSGNPIPAFDSSASGKRYAQKMADLNGMVPVTTRLPLVESLLDVYGLRAMVNAGDSDTLTAMHEQAVKLYRMGYHDAAAIDALAAMWKEKDWRGQKGARPTNGQFMEFASQNAGSTPTQKRQPKKVTVTLSTGELIETTT